MSESPDVVDTSDVEEREVLAVSEDAGHWDDPVSTPINSLRADVLASPQSSTTDKIHQRRPDSPLTLTTRYHRFSDQEVENPFTSKANQAHNVGSVSPGYSITVEASFLSNGSAEDTSCHARNSELTSQYFSESMLIGDYDAQSVSFPSRDVSLQSDWHSLFSSPSRPSAGHDSPDATSRAGPQSAESPSTSHPPPHSLSRSISNDHSGTRKLHLVSSSPLTPASSPAPLAQTSSQSPDPLQLLPTPPLQPPHPHPPWSNLASAVPSSVLSPPVEIPDDPQPLGRYSFRRREARQLNPYAHDKLLYKQQLKSHPDAIVKFCSPRHRSGFGGAGEDGTQDEFIFPLDNPDQDGDYVDIESDGGRKRRRAQGFDRQNALEQDGQGLETGHVDEGWLPEALKGLSSSDEDGDEIRKLARRVRRERERAEARARAEARRAIAEARQAKIETKQATKRRPKPFPVHDHAEQVSTGSLKRVPSEPSPSPSLLPRANSEPAMAALSPSPSRSLLRYPGASRASSNPLQSPDFSVYMQQEDSYRFDDDDPLFPRNLSPVGRTVAYSAPPSPSGPPTTSGTSALSNTSGIDSESDQSSTSEMTSKDRKRLRLLKRMMPAAMIARHLGIAKTTHPPAPRARVAVESSGSEAEEVRVIPGLARVRKGMYRDVEVRGDPESSDAERPAEVYDDDGKEDVGLGAMDLFSDGHSNVKVRRTRHASPRLKHEDDVISLSDSSMLGS
ncbi:hypothetical protein JVT61DRAFT_104 [Boletus reticuloceps]|uniref:Uncharacterized protein n=1 Tax=Boletus reticuloceps TaxID=495285 RepID=A0A8I2YXX1_9AGAM|nr:hypothetical protein JVT61DRAFT_104 [Boletus reticuloceps]